MDMKPIQLVVRGLLVLMMHDCRQMISYIIDFIIY